MELIRGSYALGKPKKEYVSFMNGVLRTLLVALPASFSFSISISSVLSALIIVVWSLLGGFQYFGEIKNSLRMVFFIFIMFMLPLVSILYSENVNISLLEKRLSFLIFPVIFFTVQLNNTIIKEMLYSFVTGCLVGSAYALLRAIQNPLLFGSEMTFYTLGISHVYYGIILSCSIIILVYFLFETKRMRGRSVLLSIGIIFLLVVLFIMGPRMAIISICILGIIQLVLFLIRTKKWILGLFLVAIPVLIFGVIMINFENSWGRFLFLFNKEYYQVGDNFWNNVGSRLSVLNCSFNVFTANPLIGTGIGDVQLDLDSCNGQMGYKTLINMNPHNQYIQVLLGTGLIGLIAFIGHQIYSFWFGFREGRQLFVSILFILVMCCLTESLYERQLGVMLFSFFYGMLSSSTLK